MNLFINFCDWWWLIWLLPFLLGLLLGWAIWSKWKKMYEDAQLEIASLNKKIELLNEDLDKSNKKNSELNSEIALLNGRIREKDQYIKSLEYDLDECKKSSGDTDNNSSSVSTNKSSMSASTVAPVASLSSTSKEEPSSPQPPADSGTSRSSSKYDKLTSDNFQIIEGIGPKMESVLKENGYKSWAEIGNATPEQLRDMLNKYGDKYKIIDPKDWPHQAALAHNGDWDKLIEFQRFNDGGNIAAADTKARKQMVKLGIIKNFEKDDLKAVEGIGPKIAELLNKAGITTWAGLAGTSVSRLKEILEAAGDRYKLADPSTWPKQADYAANEQWDELEEYQDYLQGGKDPGKA